MNPPFSKMTEVIEKIALENANVILIAPQWPSMRWYAQAMKLAFRHEVLPLVPTFQKWGTEPPIVPTKWKVVAFRKKPRAPRGVVPITVPGNSSSQRAII